MYFAVYRDDKQVAECFCFDGHTACISRQVNGEKVITVISFSVVTKESIAKHLKELFQANRVGMLMLGGIPEWL